MVFVDAAGYVGVAAGAEDGGGAGVGVDAGEVGGGEREAAIRVVDSGGVVEEEGAVGLRSNRRSSPPKMRAQNLNEACTSLKKIFLFSKSNKPPTRPLVEIGLEESEPRSYRRKCQKGVSRPTMPSGLIRRMARSTKRE